jgi:hypothetical protein
MSERWFYVYEKAGDAGVSVYGRTTEGGLATFVFSSQEAAKVFADRKLAPHDLYVLEINQTSFIDWLRRMSQDNGVTAVWLNPDPADRSWKVVPLASILALASPPAPEG